jgi:hypothetical protein
VLVGWKDNKVVYMASKGHSAEMDKCCCLYNRVKKRDIQVPFLEMYQYYCAQMGGRCRFVGQPGLCPVYRVNYRMKKWWYPFYMSSLR